ncbi:MAG: HNH endonuclease [Pseudomonadota bacterium]
MKLSGESSAPGSGSGRLRGYGDMRERIVANSVTSEAPAACGGFCWLWMGAVDRSGYPTMGVRWKTGPRKGKVRTLRAHRESVRAFTGRTVRKDYVVRHLCGCRWCVNPEHLQGGTQSQNVRDSIQHGTHWSPFYGKPSPRESPSPA